MKKEIYISVKDLFAECIRKAWVIIVSMIAFAVLLGAYKYISDKNNSIESVGEEKNNIEDTLQELNVEDYNEVMAYVNTYNHVTRQKEFLNDSAIMNIDPFHVDTANLQYYVKAADENQEDGIVVAYLSYIKNGIAEDIHQLDDSLSTEDINSLITCDATGPIDSKDNMVMPQNTNVINIYVYGQSQEQSKNLAENVKTCLENYSKKLNGFGENSISIINETYTVGNSNSLLLYQNDKINTLSVWGTRMQEEEKRISESNLDIAKQVIAIDNEEETDKDESATEETQTVRISKKFIVLGAAGGMLLAVFVIVIVYILDGKLKTAKELHIMYELRAFGAVTQDKPSALDKLANKICYKGTKENQANENPSVCISQISTLCKNLGVKDVLFVGEEAAIGTIEKLDFKKELEKYDVKVSFAGDILDDDNAVRALSSDKKVILVEKARKSYYANIDQRISEIQNQGVEILGYITVK